MKNLLLSTALVAASAFSVQAQTADTPQFMTAAQPDAIYASNFIGMRIYSSDTAYANASTDGAQKDWNDIGEVNDVVLDRSGKVDGVLVDVGGFLGMGEHEVALKMDAIKMVNDDSTSTSTNDFFLVVNATKEQLEAAPEYKRADQVTNGAANNGIAAGDPAAKPMATDTAAGNSAPVAAAPGAVATDPAAQNGTLANDNMAPVATAPGTVAPNGTMADGTAPMAGTAMNDMANWVEFDSSTITTEQLTGARVYDGKNADIGEVSELVLAADGKVDEAVVDVGGFLGLGEKPVALKMSDLKIMKQKDGDDLRVYVTQTKEQLEALPDYKKK